MINSLLSFGIVPLLFIGGFNYQTNFCNVEIINYNGTITCDSMKDTLYFQESEFIDLQMNETTDTIQIINNYTIPTPTSITLGGIFAESCNGGEYVNGIDTDGHLICVPLP